MCQQLYDYDAKLQLVPVLAAALPVLSKDKLSYTIQLRKGIQFNDGTPFNAQAVVTTVQRYMTYPGSSRASDYAGVDSVTASGPYTVVFHLKARDSTFIGGNPYVLSPTQLAKLGDNFGTEPGLRRPVHVRPPRRRRPRHRDQVALLLRPEERLPRQDRLQADARRGGGGGGAEGGRHPGARSGLDRPSSPGVRQTSSLRVLQAPQLGWRGIIINIGNKNGVGNLPYANVGTPLASSAKLRQAFEEAIDRNTLNRVVFGGLDQVSCTPIAPANTAWYDATKVPCTPYDPQAREEARRRVGLLEPDRAPADGEHDRHAPAGAVHPGAGGGGRDQRRDRLDRHARRPSRGATSGNFDARAARPRVRAAPTPTATSTGRSRPRGRANYSGYSNPRLDLILSNGLKATSIAGTVDALPRGAADHPGRPADHRPLQPDHVRGLQHEPHRSAADFERQVERRERAVQVATAPRPGRERVGALPPAARTVTAGS